MYSDLSDIGDSILFGVDTICGYAISKFLFWKETKLMESFESLILAASS